MLGSMKHLKGTQDSQMMALARKSDDGLMN